MAKKSIITTTLTCVVIFTSLATYIGWIRGADHRDFYPRWAGARRILLGSKDLYSLEATREIQLALYGQTLPPDRDQQGFAYPALLLPIILPFALIENVEIATALWEGVSVALIIIGLLLLQSKNTSYSVRIILLSLFWLFTLLMIFQGQITGLVIAVICAGYWGLYHNRDFIGGLILSIGLVKPELAIIPILVLIGLSVKKGKYLLPIGFLVGLISLFLVSVAFIGFWIPAWLKAIVRYSQYAQVVWPISLIFRINPLWGIFTGSILLIAVLWLRKSEDLLFAVSIPLSFLLLPQTLIWGLSIAMIPMNIVWLKGGKLPVFIVWLIGWLTAIGYIIYAPSYWWRIQEIIMAITVLFLVVYTKMGNPFAKTA